VIAALALAAALGGTAPPAPGPDKVKHFFVSAFVHSVAFSAARAAGMQRPEAQAAGATLAMAVGVLKEVRDRRDKGVFSERDLVWDAAGILAVGALMNGTR
jgi:uncharacterized protein YfiM (DUF2279 family)